MPGVSLLFAAGSRPTVADLQRLADTTGHFSISLDPSAGNTEGQGWLELLITGLTFDLKGLLPSEGARIPKFEHAYGVPPSVDRNAAEAVELVPGPHLAGGATMFPVVRSLALLAARLSGLDGVSGVVWHAAGACSAPDIFQRGVVAWVEGGPFPGLGLTSLETDANGGLRSRGLALLTGQELALSADMCADRARAAKIALRLINWVVEHGRIDAQLAFSGPGGEALVLEAVENSTIVRVVQGSR
ncbi:hypothetical protein [Aurantiacibacter aquimixticola]|uniref:Uncharacterized protein n=1 Tax=Aurantiacibacter aquimixticola TaxID=1958945 RepID=A0A419RRJ0_9SPHN|nr:hypothetical protein [Aurantiacibacter aquimixticola]RJY08386.1 hypothetical protein D6201_02550 [Aurantiacibacter aquimixticola]